jgi:hypothetical protein
VLPRWRAALADALGLGFLLLLLADILRPSLLLLPTMAAGGDTPCHIPTAAALREQFLPAGRLHGWCPGAYLGHPLLLYYFPLPFLVMAALAPAVGLAAAFKIGTALPVFLLPLLAYASFRLLGFRFPGPLMGAAGATLFLFLEDNPIWGGTMASMLTGEFAYQYGIGLALLFLGVVYRAYARGLRPIVPALVLAVTGVAHGYAVLWAGLSASFFLYGARRPLRTLGWLLGVASLALALASFWLLPLLSAWGFTTPYDDPWITVGVSNLVPALLAAPFLLAGLGLAATLIFASRTGGPDRRLLFLLHSGLVGAALAAAGPGLGIIDVRFVPFAQLAVCLAGAAALGSLLQGRASPDLLALALVVLAGLSGEAQSKVLRVWVDWNYSGLEAKEHWPAFRELADRLRGTVNEPRVAVEYGTEHEKAGSIRMYETLPFFSGRSTLEGVYNQASLLTHPVYYLASELGASSPNPFSKRHYASFDTEAALAHLRLFAVGDVVAVSEKLVASLASRTDASLVARIPPYTLFRLRDSAPYVEPMSHEPVRAPLRGFRDRSYRWFTRRPLPRAHLVFSEDRRFRLAEEDEWLPPPELPLPDGVTVSARLEPEGVAIETDRPGHPLLVKISYHPRWKVEGADGPYLVSPGLMMVVPRQRQVRLRYGRDLSDWVGLVATLTALGYGVRLALSRRLLVPAPPQAADPAAGPVAPRRWGGVVPGALVVALAASRLAAGPGDAEPLASALYERASRAYAEERFAVAAEYARQGLLEAPKGTQAPALRCLRGESLLRGTRPAEAALEFDTVVREHAGSPYLAQALSGSARAHDAAGEHGAAAASRERLLRELGETPWAQALRREAGAVR